MFSPPPHTHLFCICFEQQNEGRDKRNGKTFSKCSNCLLLVHKGLVSTFSSFTEQDSATLFHPTMSKPPDTNHTWKCPTETTGGQREVRGQTRNQLCRGLFFTHRETLFTDQPPHWEVGQWRAYRWQTSPRLQSWLGSEPCLLGSVFMCFPAAC